LNKREQRRAAERERQREEIFEVALAAFARRGYSGCSMNEVAAEAGYSVGHVYNVVGNKEALFEAVMLREGMAFEAVMDSVIARHATGSAAESIDQLVDRSLEFFDNHRDYFQIYLNEVGGVRANVGLVFSGPLLELDERLMRKVKRQLSLAVREGRVAAIPTSDLLIAVTELVNGFVCAWAVGGYKGRIARKSRVIKQLLWKGIQA
jgi:AcrR family transcriptional regulator